MEGKDTTDLPYRRGRQEGSGVKNNDNFTLVREILFILQMLMVYYNRKYHSSSKVSEPIGRFCTRIGDRW